MTEKKPKILIIEDNQEHLMAMAIKLQHHGYDVATARDGVIATTAVMREKPDAIILDLGLPGGDGFTVLKRLKALSNAATIPVIVVSARPETSRPFALKAGALEFLQKPVGTEVLLAVLRKALIVEAAPA